MAKKKSAGPRSVQCYHCGFRFDVSALAMTGSCAKCYGKLMFDDVIIKNTQSYRRLQTCGRLLIEPKGRVIADYVNAIEGVEVRGKIETKGYEGGPVWIRRKALWQGDCRAPSLALEEGAEVRSGFFVIPSDPVGEAARAGESAPARTRAAPDAEPEAAPRKPPMKTSSTRRAPRPAAPSLKTAPAPKSAAKKKTTTAATKKRSIRSR